MLRKILALTLIGLLLVGCNLIPAIAPTSTPTPTNTPIPSKTPTPTPTLIPIGDLDLSNLLVQTGDLPAGYTGAQIGNTLP
jgi:hypothetical protein